MKKPEVKISKILASPRNTGAIGVKAVATDEGRARIAIGAAVCEAHEITPGEKITLAITEDGRFCLVPAEGGYTVKSIPKSGGVHVYIPTVQLIQSPIWADVTPHGIFFPPRSFVECAPPDIESREKTPPWTPERDEIVAMDKPARELAEILGVSLSAVRTRRIILKKQGVAIAPRYNKKGRRRDNNE